MFSSIQSFGWIFSFNLPLPTSSQAMEKKSTSQSRLRSITSSKAPSLSTSCQRFHLLQSETRLVLSRPTSFYLQTSWSCWKHSAWRKSWRKSETCHCRSKIKLSCKSCTMLSWSLFTLISWDASCGYRWRQTNTGYQLWTLEPWISKHIWTTDWMQMALNIYRQTTTSWCTSGSPLGTIQRFHLLWSRWMLEHRIKL